MTSDQYTELVGFLGHRFDAIDRRFEAVDRRFDSVDQRIEESRRHATVLVDQSQANLKVVAEGLGLRIDGLEETVRELSETVRGSRSRDPYPGGTAGRDPGAYLAGYLRVLGYDARTLLYGANGMIWDRMRGDGVANAFDPGHDVMNYDYAF